jgi:hypothetical protein
MARDGAKGAHPHHEGPSLGAPQFEARFCGGDAGHDLISVS